MPHVRSGHVLTDAVYSASLPCYFLGDDQRVKKAEHGGSGIYQWGALLANEILKRLLYMSVLAVCMCTVHMPGA